MSDKAKELAEWIQTAAVLSPTGINGHCREKLLEAAAELTRLAKVESLLREAVREREENFKIMYGNHGIRRLGEDGWWRAARAALGAKDKGE